MVLPPPTWGLAGRLGFPTLPEHVACDSIWYRRYTFPKNDGKKEHEELGIVDCFPDDRRSAASIECPRSATLRPAFTHLPCGVKENTHRREQGKNTIYLMVVAQLASSGCWVITPAVKVETFACRIHAARLGKCGRSAAFVRSHHLRWRWLCPTPVKSKMIFVYFLKLKFCCLLFADHKSCNHPDNGPHTYRYMVSILRQDHSKI